MAEDGSSGEELPERDASRCGRASSDMIALPRILSYGVAPESAVAIMREVWG
jgi:hypothetical protein